MSYSGKDNKDIIKNQWFNGTLDAKRAFHAIVGDSEINSDVIRKLWMYRQEKRKYIDVLRVDYYFWKKVRNYWESYLMEFDRLILDSVGAYSTKETTLSLKGWC